MEQNDDDAGKDNDDEANAVGDSGKVDDDDDDNDDGATVALPVVDGPVNTTATAATATAAVAIAKQFVMQKLAGANRHIYQYIIIHHIEYVYIYTIYRSRATLLYFSVMRNICSTFTKLCQKTFPT